MNREIIIKKAISLLKEGTKTYSRKEVIEHWLDTIPEEEDREEHLDSIKEETSSYNKWEVREIPIKDLHGYDSEFSRDEMIQYKVKKYLEIDDTVPNLVIVPLDHKKWENSAFGPEKDMKWDVIDGKHRLLVLKEIGETKAYCFVPKFKNQ